MFVNEEGILPVRWLCERFRFSIKASFPRFEGIVPESELPLRSKRYCKVNKFPSSDGISPDKSLLPKFKLNKRLQFPSSFGMLPLKLFPAKFRYWRLVKLPMNWGVSPVKWFLLKLRLNNQLKIASSTGICPLNSLEFSLRNSSCDNFPSLVGISPEILIPSTCKLVRLWHSQGESTIFQQTP